MAGVGRRDNVEHFWRARAGARWPSQPSLHCVFGCVSLTTTHTHAHTAWNIKQGASDDTACVWLHSSFIPLHSTFFCALCLARRCWHGCAQHALAAKLTAAFSVPFQPDSWLLSDASSPQFSQLDSCPFNGMAGVKTCSVTTWRVSNAWRRRLACAWQALLCDTYILACMRAWLFCGSTKVGMASEQARRQTGHEKKKRKEQGQGQDKKRQEEDKTNNAHACVRHYVTFVLKL